MKTNDIKITQRTKYYYTSIDLFQTVHQNRTLRRVGLLAGVDVCA